MYRLYIFGLFLIWFYFSISPVSNKNNETTSTTVPTVLEQEEADSTQPETTLFCPAILDSPSRYMSTERAGCYGQVLSSSGQERMNQNEPSENDAQSTPTDFTPTNLEDNSNLPRQSSSSQPTQSHTSNIRRANCRSKEPVRRRQYSQFTLNSAIEAFINGMSIQQAAETYDVPPLAIYNRLRIMTKLYNSGSSLYAGQHPIGFIHRNRGTRIPYWHYKLEHLYPLNITNQILLEFDSLLQRILNYRYEKPNERITNPPVVSTVAPSYSEDLSNFLVLPSFNYNPTSPEPGSLLQPASSYGYQNPNERITESAVVSTAAPNYSAGSSNFLIPPSYNPPLPKSSFLLQPVSNYRHQNPNERITEPPVIPTVAPSCSADLLNFLFPPGFSYNLPPPESSFLLQPVSNYRHQNPNERITELPVIPTIAPSCSADLLNFLFPPGFSYNPPLPESGFPLQPVSNYRHQNPNERITEPPVIPTVALPYSADLLNFLFPPGFSYNPPPPESSFLLQPVSNYRHQNPNERITEPPVIPTVAPPYSAALSNFLIPPSFSSNPTLMNHNMTQNGIPVIHRTSSDHCLSEPNTDLLSQCEDPGQVLDLAISREFEDYEVLYLSMPRRSASKTCFNEYISVKSVLYFIILYFM